MRSPEAANDNHAEEPTMFDVVEIIKQHSTDTNDAVAIGFKHDADIWDVISTLESAIEVAPYKLIPLRAYVRRITEIDIDLDMDPVEREGELQSIGEKLWALAQPDFE